MRYIYKSTIDIDIDIDNNCHLLNGILLDIPKVRWALSYFRVSRLVGLIGLVGLVG